jgi:hypothetical protein
MARETIKREPENTESPVASMVAATPSPTPTEVKLDTSRMVVSYANFCRVTGTPEEMIVDFGLNAEPLGVPTEPLLINQRIILNFYTAKRFCEVLLMTLQRHEAAFGVLETDVQKRVVQQ